MAIPGTPEYHREWTARKQAEAAAAAQPPRPAPEPPIDYIDPTMGQFAHPVGVQPVSGEIMRPEDQLAARVSAADDEDDAEIRQRLTPGDRGMAIAGVAGTMAGQQDTRGDNWLELLSSTVTSPSAPNPLRPIRERYVGDMTSLMGQELGQTAELHQAQATEQAAHAQAYAQEAGRLQAEADVMQMKAERDAQRQRDAVAASQLVQAKVTEAADRLNESPDVDPNRYWASQSAGRKFAWGIQAALMGFAGLDPFGALNTAIERDIDAQKATFAQKQAGFDARRGELDGQRSVYSDLRQSIVDEEATDLMMRSARLQQADAAFRAMAAKEGLQPAAIANNIFLTQLQEKQAEITHSLQTILAKTPERIGGGTRPLLSPLMQKVAMAELKDARGEGNELRKLSITQAGETARSEIAAGSKEEKADLAEREFQYKMRKDQAGGEKGAAVETALQLANDWLGDYGEDVPDRTEGGIGGEAFLSTPKWLSSSEGRRELSRRKNVGHWFATALTGATVSEKQQEFIDGLIAGENMSGDDLRMGINDLKRTLEIYQSNYQRSAESAAQADYRGVAQDQMPQRDPKTGGLTRSNIGLADQAAALGGKLR